MLGNPGHLSHLFWLFFGVFSGNFLFLIFDAFLCLNWQSSTFNNILFRVEKVKLTGSLLEATCNFQFKFAQASCQVLFEF